MQEAEPPHMVVFWHVGMQYYLSQEEKVNHSRFTFFNIVRLIRKSDG